MHDTALAGRVDTSNVDSKHKFLDGEGLCAFLLITLAGVACIIDGLLLVLRPRSQGFMILSQAVIFQVCRSTRRGSLYRRHRRRSSGP